MNGLDDDKPVSRKELLDLTGDNNDASDFEAESNASFVEEQQQTTSLLGSHLYQETTNNDLATP